MAEIHDLRRARRRKRIPLPASALSVSGALGLPLPETFTHFRLRRRKRGTEVWIIGPAYAPSSTGKMLSMPFSLNLSAMLDVWPASFPEARKWVAAYAAGHGQVLEEECKDRGPRPAPEDRRVLRAGGCREAWLSSDVPELWAEAMVRCKHAGGYCGQDGFCHYGSCDMEMLPAPLVQDAPEISGRHAERS